MGIKDLKTRKVINIGIDKSLLARIDAYAAETGIPKTRLFDKALEIMLEKVKKKENIF